MSGFVFLVIVILMAGVAVSMYLLGFRLGGDRNLAELNRVRLEAAQAERQLHDLTRQAFVAMAQEVEKQRRPSPPERY